MPESCDNIRYFSDSLVVDTDTVSKGLYVNKTESYMVLLLVNYPENSSFGIFAVKFSL